jgi:hypothetical protein
MFLKGLYVLILMASLSSAYGQSHYLLSRLEATKDRNRIILNWTIKQGGSCFGIGILRSTNNIDFEKIGEITGVCGSAETEQNFVFIDENPVKNKIHYYVLELGFSGKTAPPLEAEYFEFEKSKSFVFPNPMRSEGKIKFINTSPGKYRLYLFDMIGRFISEQSTDTDEFLVNFTTEDTEHYSANNKYIYTIHNPGGQIITSGIFYGGKN